MCPARYDINCSPGKVEIVPITFEKRKDCPQGPRPHPLTSDPDMFDPRPPFPCNRNPCCMCRPLEPPKQPKSYDLKLKLLEDCYNCKVSEKCHERRRAFYDRWQQYVDRLPRMPNYDYKVYCCDDYVDLSDNKDFEKFTRFKANTMGQRERARRNFIWPEVMFQTQEEQEMMRNSTKPKDSCECTTVYDLRNKAYYAEANFHLNNIEPYTRWHELRLRPQGYVEGSTSFKSRLRPFHKDASFTTPLYEFSSGNESPFKEMRDVRVAM